MNTPEKVNAGTVGLPGFWWGPQLSKVGLAGVGSKGLSAACITSGLGGFGPAAGGIDAFAVLAAVALSEESG